MILLSHIIDSNTPTYGNRDKFAVEETSKIVEGASANSSKWIFSTNHLGTHIDMPKHFFEDSLTLTDYPEEFWYSDKVQLCEIPCDSARLINTDDFANFDIKKHTEILLIRTGYEEYRNDDRYWNDNPGINSELGKWLKSNYTKIKMIGFDFISLTSWMFRSEGKIAHQEFLNNRKSQPILIIEDMKLSPLSMSPENLLVAPIFVQESNGAPVTIFANI